MTMEEPKRFSFFLSFFSFLFGLVEAGRGWLFLSRVAFSSAGKVLSQAMSNAKGLNFPHESSSVPYLTPSFGKTPTGESSLWLVTISITLAALALVMLCYEIQPYQSPELPFTNLDNVTYYKMAQGDTSQIQAPFSRRALFPLLARGLSLSAGLSLRSAFILLDILSVALLVCILAKIIALFDLSPWIVAVFILTPFPVALMENGYMPDLFHAMLLSLFFLLILREKFLFALIVLAVAYMARENTLVLCLVFGVIAWLRNLRGAAIGSGLVILYGASFGAWALSRGLPNRHHLPDMLYLALKVPHQFLKNVFGFRIWTNTLPYGDPFVKFTLPDYLRAGDVRVVGLCYLEWLLPALTLISLLTLFGTGPLIVWSARRLKLWKEPHPLAIQVAFVYGLIAFFLGTSVGDGVERLIGYGWPLFWIGVPYLLAVMKQQRMDLLFKQSLVSFWIVAWIPTLLGYSRYSPFSTSMLTLFVTLLAYGLAWRLFRNSEALGGSAAG
jgi:hypothetical protein